MNRYQPRIPRLQPWEYIKGLFDDDFDYQTDGFIVWAWPITIPCLLVFGIACNIVDAWTIIKFPEFLGTFCRRSFYVLSLPFRPVTLGRLVAKFLHR